MTIGPIERSRILDTRLHHLPSLRGVSAKPSYGFLGTDLDLRFDFCLIEFFDMTPTPSPNVQLGSLASVGYNGGCQLIIEKHNRIQTCCQRS
jgi:hypothetical protein